MSEKDNDVSEVRVAFEQVSKSNNVGKVASLQKRFENQIKPNGVINTSNNSSPNTSSPVNSSASVDNRQLMLKLSKDKSSSPSDSSGYDSLRSNNSNVNHELDARLAQALEENDKMFRSFDAQKRKQMQAQVADETNKEGDNENKLPSVLSRIKTFNSNINKTQTSIPAPTRPSTLQRPLNNLPVKNDSKEPPPPPPPRAPNMKTNTLTHKKPTNNETSKIQRSSSVSTGSLLKSASQGDIASQSKNNPVIKSPTKTNNNSISNEDLSKPKDSPGSPSKASMASSNDSLTSSSSIVTVKSASSIKSLDKDDPPELPPRNGTLKSNLKPPIPRSPSQVS